jgi:hypothetical protein
MACCLYGGGQQQAGKVLIEFRGKVIHPGPDLPYTVVTERFPWMAHGKDMHPDSQFFKQQYFIGYKGFGNTGIPLEDHAEGGLKCTHRRAMLDND